MADENGRINGANNIENHRQYSTFLTNAFNNKEQDGPFVELPEIPAIQPLFDPPSNTFDPLQQFRPSNWRGLMAAIQNEPIDPVQFGKDIFEETRGSEAKYKCILNALSGHPFRLDLQTLYNRRVELVNRLGNDDIIVQLYDFNMGCMVKADLDRRAFNNVASIVNQNIFYKTINDKKIPEQYKFNPNQMSELIFFTPVDLDEYNATNSAEVLNHVVELNLTDQTEIARQIVLEAQNLCVKPEFLGQISITAATGKTAFMPGFFTFLKRILYQSFGVPYHKFINLSLAELSSDLPNNEYPYERATAVILLRIAMDTLKSTSSKDAKNPEDSDQSDSKKKQPPRKGRKRRKIGGGPGDT